jgi:hypothetical protein
MCSLTMGASQATLACYTPHSILCSITLGASQNRSGMLHSTLKNCVQSLGWPVRLLWLPTPHIEYWVPITWGPVQIICGLLEECACFNSLEVPVRTSAECVLITWCQSGQLWPTTPRQLNKVWVHS